MRQSTGWFGSRALAASGLIFILVGPAACGGAAPAVKSPGEGASSDSGDDGPAEIGKLAPEMSVRSVSGKGSITRESLQGKVAIVDFWATWCAPCKQSFPKLEELAKQNPGKVQVVGVSVDDKLEGVADFAKANGATFTIGWDDGHTVATRWKVESMPTTYVLDAGGVVRFIHAGYHDGEAEVVAKEIAKLAAEPPPKAGAASAPASGATDKSGGGAAGSAVDVMNAGTGDKATSGATDDSPDKTEEPLPPKKKPAGKGKPGAKATGKKPASRTPPKKKSAR